MMADIFSAFIAFWILLLPIYLWWYGASFVLGFAWNRVRFFTGLFLWAFSVWLMYILELIKSREDTMIFSGIIFLIFLVFLYWFIYILTRFGSSYARGFLRQIALGHALILGGIMTGVLIFAAYFPSFSFFSILTITFILASIFEESSKHLVSIGLAWHDFHFSKGDIMAFTLFSVLGFVFSENIIYLILGHAPIGEWIFRSFFTLIAHIFAASVCAYYWWKALSYELFSPKYIAYFSLGFLLASALHAIYNGILNQGYIVGMIAYTIIWYIILVLMFTKK